MLKGVLIGLLILVLVVFAYVGYSSYSTGRSAAASEAYADGMAGGKGRTDAKADATGTNPPATTLPAMPTTGDADGASRGLVAQTGASSGSAPPARDSIAPNPPDGMKFGGSGHYQLYRQGDLTWRLNTDTGDTCVIFATDEEWRKTKVYRAGCRGR